MLRAACLLPPQLPPSLSSAPPRDGQGSLGDAACVETLKAVTTAPQSSLPVSLGTGMALQEALHDKIPVDQAATSHPALPFPKSHPMPLCSRQAEGRCSPQDTSQVLT